MSGENSRRTFLRGTLASAVLVAGFDTGLVPAANAETLIGETLANAKF